MKYRTASFFPERILKRSVMVFSMKIWYSKDQRPDKIPAGGFDGKADRI